MRYSQNGWPVIERETLTRSWVIPGADRTMKLADGAAGFVLAWWTLWFHDRVEPLSEGGYDDWGWALRLIADSTTISNHASGTAVDLNSLKHPVGSAETRTFTLEQIDRINRRLAFVQNVIRWGGNYSTTTDAMHFEINADPATVAAVCELLKLTPRGEALAAANRRKGT